MEPRQLAAKELAHSGSIALAAKRSGFDAEQIRALQRDTVFAAEVAEYASVNIRRTASAILSAAPLAIKVLREEMKVPALLKRKKIGRPKKDEKFSTDKPDVREVDPRKVRAARILLEFFFKAAETLQLQERVKALEQQLKLSPQLPPYVEVVDAEIVPPQS